jgi:hypothetical protein
MAHLPVQHLMRVTGKIQKFKMRETSQLGKKFSGWFEILQLYK